MESLSAATTARSLVVLAFVVAQTAVAAEHLIPLFTSASNASQGFARIVNHSDLRGTVSIRATDDSGREFEPFQIILDPWEAMHFNSDHLELGDSSRGIAGIGGGTGDWRLVVTSDLELEVLAYARTEDGFLTSLHDTVRKQGTRYHVPVFNPGSNRSQASRLRLINAGEASAQVTITGVDDLGTPTPAVSISVPAGEARSVTAQRLEQGHSSLVGRLGDGAGKWRLFLTSDRDIHVMSLLDSSSGHLTNLSGSPNLSAMPAASMMRDHNVVLRVVRVTPDWMPYASTDGWTAAVVQKESDHLKYFEAAIWEETASIHLYEFDNDFDPHPPDQHAWSDDEKIGYRERNRVLEFPDMPPAYTDERSTFLRSAFESVATYIVGRFPNSSHNLMFSGHGGPGGRLFEGLMSRGHAAEFLSHWHEALGRPLGVIDMGGPCTKGGFGDLETFCPYSSYYIASDLPNGGYEMDEWTLEKHHEVSPETQYHSIFQHRSLRSALKARIDLHRLSYVYSRENMIENQTEQANYLYSCRDFAAFASALREWPAWHDRHYANTGDVRTYLELKSAPDQLVEKLDDVIVYQADNRDFFDWEVDANGILMP